MVIAVVLVTVVGYWPSLDGPFVFDDVPNLQLLGERGGVDSYDAFLEFVASAESGPLGRPLSLASFVLNGDTWPTDPRPFRVTNLLIHIVNGLLIFVLARQLFATLHDREAATRLALLCMALWMVHPLLVSTTAYVIQRMTQLASLFMLAGLICYAHGRNLLPQAPRRGWTWILAGMGTGGALALLSKESGILLPLYALVIEFTVFAAATLPRQHRRALVAILCLPLAALLGYMAVTWEALRLGFEFRPFTAGERLLTQTVVLVDYLQQVFAPHLSGLGIIHDDVAVSRGLLEPPATIISLFVIVALIGIAFWRRKRWPLFSLGILWFFAGHSLEAGPLPLELYFDHRNYLPLFGPLIAVCSLLPLLPAQLRRVAPVVIVVFFALELFLTWQSARLWSDEDLMMRTALVDHPHSLRAQQHVANRQIIGRQYEEALATQQAIATRFPEHTATRLSVLNLSCILGRLTPEEIAESLRFIESSAYDTQIVGFLAPLMATSAAGVCPAYDADAFQATVDALLRNPVLGRNAEIRGAAHYFKGMAYERSGQLYDALRHLDLSYDAHPGIDIRLQQVVWLLQRGKADEALRYLGLAEQYRRERFWRRNFRDADMKVLRQQVEQLRKTR
ncbi:MAG: hypothetical protein KJP17_10695 [Gammaproteobacteria bacterium]|nr:hypothetical protein [Gammaproteobacteria bacterium]